MHYITWFCIYNVKIFSRGNTPGVPQKRPRCLDRDTVFCLARQRSYCSCYRKRPLMGMEQREKQQTGEGHALVVCSGWEFSCLVFLLRIFLVDYVVWPEYSTECWFGTFLCSAHHASAENDRQLSERIATNSLFRHGNHIWSHSTSHSQPVEFWRKSNRHNLLKYWEILEWAKFANKAANVNELNCSWYASKRRHCTSQTADIGKGDIIRQYGDARRYNIYL